MTDPKVKVFDCFSSDWAVLSAGPIDDYNCMTIGWGALGTVWGKPAATVYVKPARYTYEFMEKNEYFTVSLFDKAYHEDLSVLGTLSGRDGDKVAKTSLTPEAVSGGVGFREAKTVLVCRLIYKQDIAPENMAFDVAKIYSSPEAPHRMYIGEVVEVIEH